jgi:hypothetical protein
MLHGTYSRLTSTRTPRTAPAPGRQRSSGRRASARAARDGFRETMRAAVCAAAHKWRNQCFGQARFGRPLAKAGIHHFGEAIGYEVRKARSAAFRDGP